jgi:hypothetical protein
MSFTTVAFSQSVATAATYNQINAVPDQHIKTQGTSIYVSMFNKFIGAMACLNTNALRANLTSPSIRRFAPLAIQPINLALFPGASQNHDVDDYRVVTLDIDEQLECQFLGTALAASQVSICAWLADAEIKEVYGDIRTIQGTITLALTAGTWVGSNLTLIDDLPVGVYSVVGLDSVIATAVCARLIPIGGSNRPGAPCRQLVSGEEDLKTFRHGRLGEWFSFPHNSIPMVEVLGSAAVASATYDVWLDLIKK